MCWHIVWIRWEDGIIRPHAVYDSPKKAGTEWDRLCRLDPKLDVGVWVVQVPPHLAR